MDRHLVHLVQEWIRTSDEFDALDPVKRENCDRAVTALNEYKERHGVSHADMNAAYAEARKPALVWTRHSEGPQDDEPCVKQLQRLKEDRSTRRQPGYGAERTRLRRLKFHGQPIQE